MAVGVGVALRVREAAGPLGGGAPGEPAVHEAPEPLAPYRKELGAVVEAGVPDAAGRHPAADAPALVQNRYAPTGVV